MSGVTKPRARSRHLDIWLLCTFGFLSMVLSSSLVLLFHIFGRQLFPYYDEPPPFKLPSFVLPYYYELNLKIYPILNAKHDFGEYNNTIHGQVDVHFKCYESTSIIIMNAYDLSISKSLVIRDLKEIDLIEVIGIRYYHAHRQVVFFLQKPLKKGHKYGLFMNYIARIGDDRLKNKEEKVGAYTSPVDDNEIDKVLVTQFQFFEASRVFPCFDEPDKKANFNLNLIYPSGYHAVSNMPEVGTHNINRHWKHTEFDSTPLMSPYLFAFYIGNFGVSEVASNGFSIRFFARNDTLPRVLPAQNLAVAAVNYFQDYFGIQLPVPKIDFIVVGKLIVAGMENWGMVTVRDSEIIFDYGISDDERFFQKTADVIIHEICHQWVGNLVSPKTWDEYWFFEGMTAYISNNAMSHVVKDPFIEEILRFRDKEMTIDMDEIGGHVMRTLIKGPVVHSQLPSPFFYKKGYCVLKILEATIGQDTITEAIQQYLTKYSYGSATAKDFFDILDEILEAQNHPLLSMGISSMNFVYSWATNPGIPEVSVKKLNATHSIVSQGIYDPLGINNERFKNLDWIIPIVYNHDGQQEMAILSNGDQLQIPTKIISHKMLYLIKYDQNSVLDLIDEMDSEDERTNFFLNVYFLMLKGDLPLDTVITAMKKLLNTDSRLSVFTYFLLSRHLLTIFYDSPLRAQLELVFGRPLEDAFDEYVVNYSNDFGIHKQHLAETLMLFMCELQYKPCVSMAINYLKDIKQSCENTTERDCIDTPIPLRRGIYNTIVSTGNQKDVKFLQTAITRRTDYSKLNIAFSFQSYDDKDGKYDELQNPVASVTLKGKGALKNGVSMKVIDFVRSFVTENCKKRPVSHFRFLMKSLEFASLYANDFMDDFFRHNNCTEVFIASKTPEFGCEMLKRRSDHVTKDEQVEDVEIEELSFRLKIVNFPKFLKYPQVKQFLESNLKGLSWRKLKAVPGVAYFSMTNEDDVLKALETINNKQYKGKTLEVKRVANEKEQTARKPNPEDKRLKTASEITTPYSNMAYEKQLEIKFEECKKTALSFIRQLKDAHYEGARYLRAEQLVRPIIRSPVLTNYRNKCEFTVGRDSNGEPCVGFVSGRMAEREIVVVSPFDSVILTENTYAIVKKFTEYVKASDLPVFEEFERSGFWKMLTVRDFVGDCMIIFTTHSLEDAEKLQKVQNELVELFLKFGDVKQELETRVTSVYWQILENASDPVVYQHLAGVPYLYETVLGVRFRVSPATFFQTNSRGAEVLYSTIGDALGLPVIQAESAAGIKTEDVPTDTHNGGPEAKKPKSEDKADVTEIENGSTTKPTVVLDICCGAGTIGQCLLRRLERGSMKEASKYLCVGVELIEQAVKDARVNANDNGFGENNCRYLSGQAEVIFPGLQYHLPKGITLEESEVVGVLDPPRAGITTKVIISCRKLESLKKLVYVSCDPKAALKNVVDLCRPTSKKYEGDPFKVAFIQPVDMFPQTSHFEWVILLHR
ncbi:unnamed protein product [Bursaphelenchus okinawaensis]|uniref:tRNA (uracil(54)-C(5))-methyltransferase n=1 Tax=Bursaphelenchus okinawaensis TaxID=465554 RepID=A0A811LCU0_9BILA|nr:unnamed protein product [Bursaphelenchus okinawaensis]CAG9120295.1 unnamed protein product [Bursaphelenchus okinawaensis]